MTSEGFELIMAAHLKGKDTEMPTFFFSQFVGNARQPKHVLDEKRGCVFEGVCRHEEHDSHFN